LAGLDQRLKLADPDRWLATRFIADPAARADVVALYALDLELGAVAARATNPLMAEIRFAWWRERCEALAEGASGGEHPVLTALAPALAPEQDPERVRGRFALAAVATMIAARHAELADPWFGDEAGLDLYLEDLDVSLMMAVATRLDPAVNRDGVYAPARLSGLARLARREADAIPPWWPQTWRGLADETGRAEDVIGHLRHKLGQLQRAARTGPRLSPAAFPAIAHVALALDRHRGPLARRLRVTLAVATGRI
jgi:phytoene synthase